MGLNAQEPVGHTGLHSSEQSQHFLKSPMSPVSLLVLLLPQLLPLVPNIKGSASQGLPDEFPLASLGVHQPDEMLSLFSRPLAPVVAGVPVPFGEVMH